MRNFAEELELEIIRTKKLLERSRRLLEDYPRGHLAIRKRKKSSSYYWEVDEKRRNARHNKQINISKDREMVLKLTDKTLQKEIYKNCKSNLTYLERLSENYKAIDVDATAMMLNPKYQDVLAKRKKQMLENWLVTPYSKCPYDSRYHTHETDYGEFVRSKSEQILANALYAYGIPFHYEEEFVYKEGEGNKIFADFTIRLPDGRYIIWEHLGLLSNEKYCRDNVRKLNLYQVNGLVIGDNLILTMDDNKNNFSSGIINKVIKEQILPHFAKIKVDRQKIVQGIRPVRNGVR